MKRLILKEMARKPTTWLAVMVITGAFIVLVRTPIPFPAWHWHLLGNYLIALAISVPGDLIIGFNLGKILKAHDLLEQPKSTE